MKLVIVETPAQAKVLTDVLGEGWRVEACYGLVRDLVDGKLGIDLAADFRPTFALVPGKGNLARRLMKALRDCDVVYAATPPGRAGELMAWQVLALAPEVQEKQVHRAVLSALTPERPHAGTRSPSPTTAWSRCA